METTHEETEEIDKDYYVTYPQNASYLIAFAHCPNNQEDEPFYNNVQYKNLLCLLDEMAMKWKELLTEHEDKTQVFDPRLEETEWPQWARQFYQDRLPLAQICVGNYRKAYVEFIDRLFSYANFDLTASTETFTLHYREYEQRVLTAADNLYEKTMDIVLPIRYWKVLTRKSQVK